MIRSLFFVLTLSSAIIPGILHAQNSQKSQEFYQISIYHFTNADQQKVIETYLKEAYLPALHKQQIKNIGVFSPIGNDTTADKRVYVIVPLQSLSQVVEAKPLLEADAEYQTRGKSYLQATYKSAPYNRIENILLQAFPMAPALIAPKLGGPKSDRVYELRSYESATENIFRNKVKMFNEGGEVDLFKRLDFNAIFYSSVIAGSHMPNLMYMTSFENMADREAHWKKFGSDPEWKKLSAMPEYQNNVSKIEITFLKSADYSDY